MKGALNWLVSKVIQGLQLVGTAVSAVGRYLADHIYLIFLAVAPGVFAIMQLLRWGLNEVFVKINAVAAQSADLMDAGGTGGLSFFYFLTNINYIFPLTETFYFLGAWATLKLALILYRLIKSWIPTLS